MWVIHGPPTEFTSKKHLAFVEKLVSCPTGQKQMVSRLTTRHQIAGVVDLELHPSVQAAKEELFNIFGGCLQKALTDIRFSSINEY